MDINLIDITEMFVSKRNISFSRLDDNEIFVSLDGEKSTYNLSVILKQEYEIIYFSSDMELIVPDSKYSAITDALAKANERIWVGHFDLISSESRVVYSLTIPFISSFSADEDFIESTLQLITDECDRFYHYFFMIIENRELSDLSISTLFLESAGEA